MGDREKTLYTVLWLHPETSGWMRIADTRANNPAEACKNVALQRVDTEPHDGRYVAVPASSWKPVEITLETQTVAKIGVG